MRLRRTENTAPAPMLKLLSSSAFALASRVLLCTSWHVQALHVAAYVDLKGHSCVRYTNKVVGDI